MVNPQPPGSVTQRRVMLEKNPFAQKNTNFCCSNCANSRSSIGVCPNSVLDTIYAFTPMCTNSTNFYSGGNPFGNDYNQRFPVVCVMRHFARPCRGNFSRDIYMGPWVKIPRHRPLGSGVGHTRDVEGKQLICCAAGRGARGLRKGCRHCRQSKLSDKKYISFEEF